MQYTLKLLLNTTENSKDYSHRDIMVKTQFKIHQSTWEIKV